MNTPTPPVAGRDASALPYVALLGTMVSVQFGAVFAKQLFPVLGVERTTFLRLGLGAVLLAPVFRTWSLRIARTQWLLVLLYSAVLGGMNLCFYSAVQRIPLGIAVAIEFIGPLGVAVALSHRRIDWLWVALAVAGLLLLLPLTETYRHGAHALDRIGIAFALCSAALWATYSVLTPRLGASSGTGVIALVMMIAAVLMLPVAALQPGSVAVTPHVILAAFVVALFSGAIPYSLEMFALKGMPIRIYGTFTSLEPAIGTLMGLWLLRELPSPQQLAGIAAIMAASLGAALAR